VYMNIEPRFDSEGLRHSFRFSSICYFQLMPTRNLTCVLYILSHILTQRAYVNRMQKKIHVNITSELYC
jgi:hypothetical protein